MIRWQSRDGETSQWGITAEDESPADFPSEERLRSLFKSLVAPDGDLKVIERAERRIVVQTSPPVKPKKCEEFLQAIWKDKETFFYGVRPPQP